MKDHWLVRETTIRRVWAAFAIVFAITILLDLAIERETHFGLDGTFAFGAWFGFASCVALIFLAKAFGAAFKRRDTYYDR